MAREADKFKIGLFVIITVVLFLSIIIWLGATKFFQRYEYYVTYFDESISGLDVGSNISLRGVPVGAVSSIKIASDGKLIEVQMKFFNEARIRAYARLASMTIMLLYACLIAATYRSYRETGAPIPGHDFLVFYGAGLLSKATESAQGYDIEALFYFVREAFPTIKGYAGWFYPPIYLPLCELLSTLPYFAAYLCWISVTALLFLWSLRPFITQKAQFWVILAAPAFCFGLGFAAISLED